MSSVNCLSIYGDLYKIFHDILAGTNLRSASDDSYDVINIATINKHLLISTNY